MDVKFFCLNPKYEIYKKSGARNGDIWDVSVLATYGEIYQKNGIVIDNLDRFKNKFKKTVNKISTSLLNKPNRKNLNKIWQIFFVTGELQFLQIAYNVTKNPKASQTLKDFASQLFDEYRESYEVKITSILNNDPKYFINHPIKDVDFKPVLSSSETFKIFCTNIEKLPDRQVPQDTEIQEALNLFDEIAKRVMTKIKI